MPDPDHNGFHRPPVRPVATGAREALADDEAAAAADQSASGLDQTAQDTDQTGSERDEAAAESDQAASNRDQSAADRDRAGDPTPSIAEAASYERSREERDAGTVSRLQTRAARDATTATRLLNATDRDATAQARDDSARRRDARAEAIDRSIAASRSSVADQLQLLRTHAAADRARAAADRERAAEDRAAAARDRARLEDTLRTAHLDDLTGAFRRGMGRLAISNEIDRARRGDGRFVLAFVDVDGMKWVNDRHGHAAGDLVLQALVRITRSRLRPFDPIVRYGGDEFVCGLGGVDVLDVEARFRDIDRSLRGELGVGISVGFASLEPGDTPDQLTARADAALLEAKALLAP